MDEELASDLFERFLRQRELECNQRLGCTSRPTRFSAGWVFYYQSRAYLDTENFSSLLVGQGPVLVCDDGQIIAGGSLDYEPEELFKDEPLARIAAARNIEIARARGRRKVRGSKT